MNVNKKGVENTSAGSVAVLIILIALFIIVYVMLLSPEDRDNLLFENGDEPGTSDVAGDDSSSIVGVNILTQTPGLMLPEDKGGVIHTINPVDLYIKSEPVVEDLSNLLTVSKGLFSKKSETLSFKVDSIDNVDNANLYFNVQKGKGNLVVFLNGNKISDSEIKGIGNIVLPSHLLLKDNVLLVEVSGVGGNIFGKNEYMLNDIKIRLKYELTNTKERRNVLLGADEDGEGLLKYFIYCKEADQGARLRIFVNEKVVSNEVVSCISGQREFQISEKDLYEGKENEIMFTIDEGEFLINDITFEVESDTPGYKEYKFSIIEKEFDNIIGEKVDVMLEMEFSGGEERKAEIVINGNNFDVDTDEASYEQDISRFVEEGNNYIRIIPKREFIIDSLDIKFD